MRSKGTWFSRHHRFWVWDNNLNVIKYPISRQGTASCTPQSAQSFNQSTVFVFALFVGCWITRSASKMRTEKTNWSNPTARYHQHVCVVIWVSHAYFNLLTAQGEFQRLITYFVSISLWICRIATREKACDVVLQGWKLLSTSTAAVKVFFLLLYLKCDHDETRGPRRKPFSSKRN